MRVLTIALAALLVAVSAFGAGESEHDATGYADAPQIIDVSFTHHEQNIIKYDIDVEDNLWSRHLYDQIGLRYKPVFTQASSIREYWEKVKLMVVAGEDFDIFRADYPWEWQGSGAIGEYNDLVAEHGPNILTTIPEYSLRAARVDGELVGVPVPEYATSKHVMMIRKDWLDALGLDVPVTLDEYEEFFEAVKATDMDGNGELDEFGISSDRGLGDIYKFAGGWGFAHFNDEGTYVDLSEREIVFWSTTDAARGYYQTMAEWFERGYIDPDSISQDRTGRDAKIANGKVGMISSYIRSVHNMERNIYETTGVLPEIVPAPPIHAEVQAGYHSNFPADRIFAVYAGSDRIVESIQFLDYLCSEDGMFFVEYGLPGYDHDIVDGEPVLRAVEERNQGMLPTLSRFGPVGEEFFWMRENRSTRRGYARFVSNQEWIDERMEHIDQWHDETIPEWGVSHFQLWRNYVDTSTIPEYQLYPDYMGPHREYRLRFLTGQLDAGNDADWNEYLDAMDAAGLNAVLDASAEVFFEYYDAHPDEFLNGQP